MTELLELGRERKRKQESEQHLDAQARHPELLQQFEQVTVVAVRLGLPRAGRILGLPWAGRVGLARAVHCALAASGTRNGTPARSADEGTRALRFRRISRRRSISVIPPHTPWIEPASRA